MKTITIPDYKNPFTVTINNNVYRYKGGETVEVPDEVAEAIEDALELVPKPKRYLSKIAQLAEGSIPEIIPSDLEGIETIVYYAFGQCFSLVRINFSDSIKVIRSSAFISCLNLEVIRFGDNSKIENIKESAFENCMKLSKIYLPPKPPVLDNINAFKSVKADCTFYCKTQASLDAYKAAPNWSTLTGTYSFVVEE